MEKLKKLIDMCKASISIEINDHKSVYQSADQALADMKTISQEEFDDIEPAIMQKMIDNNTIVRIQFYPNTPVSFLVCYHYDVEMALDEILLYMENKISKEAEDGE